MTGRYKAYPVYKNSGINWLGDIPNTWKAVSLKRIANLVTGMTPSTSIEEYYSVGESECPWVRPEDISESSSEVKASKFLTKLGWDTQRPVEKNSTLICCIGTIGKCAYTSETVVTNQQITSATFQSSKKYYYYVLLAARTELEEKATGNVVKILNSERLGQLKIPLSTFEEQQKIADFLDHETAKIDTLITKQEKLIELLKEKRQAVISHAVTKGLNPDVPMKDSGVEWLGEVPKHWEVKKIKHCASLISSKQKIDDQPVIALENIESLTGYFVPTNSNYDGEDVAFIKGDILFGKLRPYLAKVFLCKKSGIAFGDLLTFRPHRQTESSFLFYTMISSWFIEMVDSSTYGAKMPRASSEFVNEMLVSFPPLEEQKIISTELDVILHYFKDLTDKANRAIKLMNERKIALISATVTGKVDVRNWQVN